MQNTRNPLKSDGCSLFSCSPKMWLSKDRNLPIEAYFLKKQKQKNPQMLLEGIYFFQIISISFATLILF